MSMSDGVDADDIGHEMARLETALERIAVLSADALTRAVAVAAPGDADGHAPDNSAVVAQLDGMIARLRAVIADE